MRESLFCARNFPSVYVLLKKNATGITTRQNASSFFFFLRKFLRKESFREDFRDERHTNVYSSSRFEKQKRETRKAEERGREVLTRKQRDSKKKSDPLRAPARPHERERERKNEQRARQKRDFWIDPPLFSFFLFFFFFFFCCCCCCVLLLFVMRLNELLSIREREIFCTQRATRDRHS